MRQINRPEDAKSYRGTPLFSVRLGGQLATDARAAAATHVGGLSGLIREGLALRLYGTRKRRTA